MRRFAWLVVALALAAPAAAQTGRVSQPNSTTSLLTANSTFTGAWDDATQAAVVVVTVKSDQASATNGLKVEFSSDCVNQDYVATHSFTDTTNGQTFADAMAAKCVRVEFVNGSSGQATFRLQTVVRDNGFGGTSSGGGTASSVTINDPSVTTQKAAVNASGQLSITCANCSGSGASAVDRSTFTFGTTSGAPSGGVFDDTPPTALTAGMFAVPRLTANRAFHVNFRNQAGTEIGTASNPIQVSLANTAANATAVKVDNSAVTQPISGTITANQGGTWTVQPGNTANTTAWKVDGSAVTQPVSGTVTANLGTLNGAALDASVTGLEVAQASTTSGQKGALIQGAVTTNAPSYTTAQTDPLSLDPSGLLRISLKDTPANTTAFKVDGSAVTQPVSGTMTANQGGTWTVQPGNTANTTAWKVDGSAVTQPVSGTVTANAGTGTFNIQANASVNVAQVNGVTTLTGVGAAGTGTQRIVDVASGTTGSAPPAQASYVGGLQSGATGGLLGGVSVCDLSKPINISTATTTLMVTGVSGRQVRICSFHMITALANNVAWLEGTGATCGTGTAGMAGGTTAASGYNFAANGGIAIGAGVGEVLTTATTGDSVCLITSAATQLSGFIKYTIF